MVEMAVVYVSVPESALVSVGMGLTVELLADLYEPVFVAESAPVANPTDLWLTASYSDPSS